MTGAVIALTIKQPAIAIPLSFLSHFAQDLVPHWDYGIKKDGTKLNNSDYWRFAFYLLLDFCFAIFLMSVLAHLFPSQKWLIWSCMIAAAAPDLMWAYYHVYLGYKKREVNLDPVAKMHQAIQWSQTTLGGLAEVAWFVGSWLIVLSFK